MPDSLEAALVFSILIVPGYLLLRGYYVGRAHTLPDRDLHVLAQAVVGSLIWLAATWVVVEDLLGWINADTVDDHVVASYAIGAAIVIAPYLVGRLSGQLVAFASGLEGSDNQIAQATHWVVFRLVAVIEHPTSWEKAWAGRSQAWVQVTLEGDVVVRGQYAEDSKVDVAPLPPRLYLEKSYATDSDGTIIEQGSVYIDGSRIMSVEFLNG
jgi:Family of unknown function (DUF6338)